MPVQFAGLLIPSFLTRAGRWLPGGQRKSQRNRKQVGAWGQGRGCQAKETLLSFMQEGVKDLKNAVL